MLFQWQSYGERHSLNSMRTYRRPTLVYMQHAIFFRSVGFCNTGISPRFICYKVPVPTIRWEQAYNCSQYRPIGLLRRFYQTWAYMYPPPCQTRQNSPVRVCHVCLGSVNWIHDNSRLSPTEKMWSLNTFIAIDHVVHTATPDRTVK